MKKILLAGLAVGSFVMLTVEPAAALFTNGGFEDGNTNGWSVTGDNAVVSLPFVPQYNSSAAALPSVPYYGNYSLQLGSSDLGYVAYDNSHASSASQTGTITQADVDNGLNLFFRWGAFLEEPTNGYHPQSAMPYFSVKLSAENDNVWSQIYYYDQYADETGFAQVGTALSSAFDGAIWYGTDLVSVSLTNLGLGLGDKVKIELYVQDCQQGGHGGMVFFDGIGTTRPIDPVPEPATMLLFGTGVAGLAAAGRRKRS